MRGTIEVLQSPEVALNDKPVEYRVSTLHTAVHEYVHTLQRPS